MKKIRNLAELKEIEYGYLWIFDTFGEQEIYQWDGERLLEMCASDMAASYRDEWIVDAMFPMYLIPEPPPRPEVVEAASRIAADLEAAKAAIEAAPAYTYEPPVYFRRTT